MRAPGVMDLGLIAVLLLLGCGDGGSDASSRGASQDGELAVEGSGMSVSAEDTGRDNILSVGSGEELYHSPEGNYRIAWPAGCSSLGIQTQNDTTRVPADLILAKTYCDREGSRNEGCSVSVYFRPRDVDGGPPTPSMVIEICKKAMNKFGVVIAAQQPIRKGEIEGIQLHCQEPNDNGQVWIEGLLAGERIYLLMAWKASGALFADPEYERFFSSFTLAR